MPSNNDPSVAGLSYTALIRLNKRNQYGSAMLFPSALYRAESTVSRFLPLLSVHAPMSVHPSGKPWSRSHSTGVNRLTVLIPINGRSFSCDVSVVLVPSCVNPLCPFRSDIIIGSICSPPHTNRTYSEASRTHHLRAIQRNAFRLVLLHSSFALSLIITNGTLPPGSHPLRQGLAYIVILDFDSAVRRMMFQAEDNRLMMLHIRSERSSNVIRNIHYCPPPDHSVQAHMGYGRNPLLLRSAFSTPPRNCEVVHIESDCFTMIIGVLFSVLSNTFIVSHTSVSFHP